MDYEKTVNLSSNPDKAFSRVRDVFIQNNFRITSSAPHVFEVEGPGMNNNHVNPLLAISRARITLSGRTLAIEAELGAVRRFGRMMVFFFILLAVFMVSIFTAVFWHRPLYTRWGGKIWSTGKVATFPWILLLTLLPFAPWPFVLPLMIGSFRKKAVRAIDTLMENAAL